MTRSRKNSRSGKVSKGLPPLQQAIQWAQERFAGHPDLLAVGAGLKFSRRSGGYRGRRNARRDLVRGVPCVKFLVQRKPSAPHGGKRARAGSKAAPERPLPKAIVFRHRGRRRRILTDVEEAPDLEQQAGPSLFIQPDNKGSATVVVQESGNPAARYLLTAGHVVPLGTAVVGEPLASPRGQVVQAVPVGEVDPRFRSPVLNGALLDAAAIRLTRGVPPFLNQPPWVGTQGTWSWSQALSRVQQGQVVRFRLTGAYSSAVGILDAVWAGGGSFPLQGVGTVVMAGPMAAVRMEDLNSKTIGGDSGSLWVDAAGQALTVHQIGGTSGGKRISWGQFLDVIIETMSQRLGTALERA